MVSWSYHETRMVSSNIWLHTAFLRGIFMTSQWLSHKLVLWWLHAIKDKAMVIPTNGFVFSNFNIRNKKQCLIVHMGLNLVGSIAKHWFKSIHIIPFYLFFILSRNLLRRAYSIAAMRVCLYNVNPLHECLSNFLHFFGMVKVQTLLIFKLIGELFIKISLI